MIHPSVPSFRRSVALSSRRCIALAMAIPGHCSAPARSSLLLRFLCFLWAAPAFADALPTRCWTNDVGRVNAAQLEVARGETIALEAQLTDGSGAFALPAGCAAALWWQTNGMARSWWQASASSTTGGLLRATWAPSNDCGAASYRFFISAAPGGTTLVYRAFGSIRMLPSPGATPNALPLPVASIDFASVPVYNAPWLLPAATNAALAAAKTYADRSVASCLRGGDTLMPYVDSDDAWYYVLFGGSSWDDATSNNPLVIPKTATTTVSGEERVVAYQPWVDARLAAATPDLSASTNYTDTATNAALDYVAGSYLSLTGGTVTGNITCGNTVIEDGVIKLRWGSVGNGSFVGAAGGNCIAGGFKIIGGGRLGWVSTNDVAEPCLTKNNTTQNVPDGEGYWFDFDGGATGIPADCPDTVMRRRDLTAAMPSGVIGSATNAIAWSLDAQRITVEAGGTLTASTNNWPDGQAMLAIIDCPASYSVADIALSGYGTWQTNCIMQAVAWRVGTNIWATIIQSEAK